eukprot:6936494-Pyramimonas_sp.AAC.1
MLVLTGSRTSAMPRNIAPRHSAPNYAGHCFTRAITGDDALKVPRACFSCSAESPIRSATAPSNISTGTLYDCKCD